MIYYVVYIKVYSETPEGAPREGNIFRECTEDNHYGCMDRQEDDTVGHIVLESPHISFVKDIHECYCENSECNKNFETAGESGQETTSQPEETIQVKKSIDRLQYAVKE